MTRTLVAAVAAALISLPPAGQWQDAPAYVPLFAPAGTRAAAYHSYVSRLGMDAVLAQLARDPSFLHPPGSWSTSAQLPSDAFGQTGRYDRSKLARLYGSKRALVARGPRGSGSRPTEAWTLVSPYPSPDLARLEPGTLLIVVDLAGN